MAQLLQRIGQSLSVAGSYLAFGAVLLACAKFAAVEPKLAEHVDEMQATPQGATA